MGAILRYAVTVSISGIELQTVGLILMIVGIIGLVISLAVLFMANDDRPRRNDARPAPAHSRGYHTWRSLNGSSDEPG